MLLSCLLYEPLAFSLIQRMTWLPSQENPWSCRQLSGPVANKTTKWRGTRLPYTYSTTTDYHYYKYCYCYCCCCCYITATPTTTGFQGRSSPRAGDYHHRILLLFLSPPPDAKRSPPSLPALRYSLVPTHTPEWSFSQQKSDQSRIPGMHLPSPGLGLYQG